MQSNFQQIISQIQSILTVYGLKIIAALAILILGRIAAGIIQKIARSAGNRAKMDPTISSFIANIAFIGIMAFAAIAALSRLGVETTSFIAVLGAAGLAIGLAFQGSLANFAAGFLMILFRPFKVGDFIKGAGVEGVVKEIQVFTTTVITMDNKKVIIPNSKITGDSIFNYTSEKTRRVDLVVGVSYSDDLDKVKQVLSNEVTSFPGVLADPAPKIAVSEMADSSVNFVVRPWVNTADYWNVYFGLTEAIKKRLDKEGISIPFPQRDVHMYK